MRGLLVIYRLEFIRARVGYYFVGEALAFQCKKSTTEVEPTMYFMQDWHIIKKPKRR